MALSAQHELIDVEARTLVDMTYPLAWSSARSAMEVNERALRLSARQKDALQSARTRARCLSRRIWVTAGTIAMPRTSTVRSRRFAATAIVS